MENPKVKLLFLTLILFIFTTAIVYLTFSQFKELKIFGCTEFDIYQGAGHEKFEPRDLYCNLDLLEIAPNSRAEDLSVGLVEYNLNLQGYITLLLILVVIPFVLSYSIVLFSLKSYYTRKEINNGKINV